jgi:hypothetical protein
MPTRRPVHVDDNATTIRETNRFLKMPHSQPKTDEHHAANVRELERWGNRIPYNTSAEGDCCSCWRFFEYGGITFTSGSPGTTLIDIPTDPFESFTLDPDNEVEVPGREIHIEFELEIPNTTTPGEWYRFITTVSMGAAREHSLTFIPNYAPSNPTGTTFFYGEIDTFIYPASTSALYVSHEFQYFDPTGAEDTLPDDIGGNFQIWNKKSCFWYLEDSPG